MNTKTILLCAASLMIAGCNVENSDGSDKRTYSSCSITESEALFASDRARDVAQCWDGVNYEEKSLALNWCSKKVNEYMGQHYTFGHTIKYQVASTNCP